MVLLREEYLANGEKVEGEQLTLAIYCLSAQIIGRSSGRSSIGAAAYRAADKLIPTAVAAAAYRSGGELQDNINPKPHDYRNKTGVAYTEIMLPENAPNEFQDRATLWNAVEESEKRKDAQTAREIMIALPRELDLQENVELLHEYIQENFVNEGMCADFAVHDKKDGNPHTHIMLTTRDVSEKGFEKKNRDWNKPEYLEQWRENWSVMCNEKLQAKGFDERIDHRTLEAQGFEREPTIHYGRSEVLKQHNQEIIKQNEKYLPENVAEHMNKLQDGYKLIEKQIENCAENQREIKITENKIADMEARAIEITKKREELAEALLEREHMKFWQSKKEINARIGQLESSESNARKAFAQKFGIEFDNVSGEIEKLENQKSDMSRKFHGFTVERLADERKKIIKEYQKQMILTEIRPDGKEILSRLHKASPQMERIADETRAEIIQELTPEQVRVLAEKQTKEREEKSRVYERMR